MSAFALEIITPESVYFSGKVDMATLPGVKGEFGVLAHHRPIVSALQAGAVTLFDKDKQSAAFFISDGFVDMSEGGCIVLVQDAFDLKDYTLSKATKERDELKNRLDDHFYDDQKDKIALQLEKIEALVAYLEA